MKRVKERMPYLEGHSKRYLAEGKERGYIEDRGPKRKNGSALRSELYVVARPAQPRITRPRWNQSTQQREYWEAVRSVPELDKMTDAELVEMYEAGHLDLVVSAIEAGKAPVSHSEPLSARECVTTPSEDLKPLESDLEEWTFEDVMRVLDPLFS